MSSSSRLSISDCWQFSVLGAALACAAIAPPYMFRHGLATASYILRQGFALVCHQRPERSFFLLGAPVAVCTRCLGIYIGAAMGLLLRTSRSLALRLLVAATSLNALDALAENLGLHGNQPEVRFLLGLLLGIAGALLISSSISRSSEPQARALA